MHFKIGEKVSFLNEVGYGTVKAIITDRQIIIQDETGFERKVTPKELVKIYGDSSEIVIADAMESIRENVFDKANNQSNSDQIKKNNGKWEIDLHTHQLLDSETGLSPSDLLRHQLAALKSFYREAREKRIKKLIIIHGVGKGVLKHEVRSFLSSQINLDFFDADFREYGKGATEVLLFYNFSKKL